MDSEKDSMKSNISITYKNRQVQSVDYWTFIRNQEKVDVKPRKMWLSCVTSMVSVYLLSMFVYPVQI